MTLFVMVRPLWFHLRGLDEKESAEINALIVENGGKIAVANAPPIMTFTTRKSHIPGNIEFNIQYIRDCVKLGKILDLTPYKLATPGPYDGCLMSLFIYQHGNCERFIMRSSTSRYGRHKHCMAQKDSIPDIQMARPSPDAINTIDQFEGLHVNCAAKLDTNDRVESSQEIEQLSILMDDDTENIMGSQAVDYFPENLISDNIKRESSEHATKSPVLNRKRKMEIEPTILVIDSSSESSDIINNSETDIAESGLEMPSVTNDAWITNEEIENLLVTDTRCPASISPRHKHKRKKKLLAEGSSINAADEKKYDEARASSLSVSNIESHRNSTLPNVTVDKVAVPLQNESALSKGGTKVLKNFPRYRQKSNELHSRSTNQKSPVTVTKTNVAGHKILRSTSMDQVSPRADAKADNDEQTDKNKYNLNRDTQITWNGDTNEDDSPLRDSTVESDINSDSSDEIDEIFVSRPNVAKTKTQEENDISKPSTSSAGLNTAKIKTRHKNDNLNSSSSCSARPNTAKIERRHNNDNSNQSSSGSARFKNGTMGKWYDCHRTRRGLPGRKFEEWERHIMVRYLIDNDCISEVRGLKIWSNMIENNILTHRTAASLNNHFRKSLIYDVLDYDMPESIKKEFRRIKQKIVEKGPL